MYYINIKVNNEVETIDEFETLKETKEMLKEYRISDNYNNYYMSTRSTKEWRNKNANTKWTNRPKK